MGLLSSNQTEGRKDSTKNGLQGRGPSIVGAGTRIVGEIEVEGELRIEGTVEGTIRGKSQVLVAEGGLVEGDIFAEQAVACGEVRGGIVAESRVEVHATSEIKGDISTPRIAIHEGAQIDGRIRMTNRDAAGQPNDDSKDVWAIPRDAETAKPLAGGAGRKQADERHAVG